MSTRIFHVDALILIVHLIEYSTEFITTGVVESREELLNKYTIKIQSHYFYRYYETEMVELFDEIWQHLFI
jgi:hypothetical protein